MPSIIELSCAHCRRLFTRDSALHRHDVRRGRRRVFCSNQCRYAAKNGRIPASCEQCGSEFIRNARTLRRQRAATGHIFCSRQCAWASPLRSGLIGARKIALKPRPDIRLSERDLGYIAGLIDGEGSFTMYAVRQRQVNVSLTVANTDTACLDFCHSRTGCGQVHEAKGKSRNPLHRTQYVWTVTSRNEIGALAELVEPVLIIKPRQARIVREFCERRAEGGPLEARDMELVAMLKDTNQRRI